MVFFKKDVSVEELEKMKIEELDDYNSKFLKRMDDQYKVAEAARSKGLDPDTKVEIPRATDMAARTEGLVGPPNVAQRIREILKDKSRDEMVFQLIKEIIDGKFGHYEDREKLAEQCVRTGLTILTEAVVAASLEGVSKVKIKKNDDGTEYLAVYFAGPIRSAGGTGQAQTVVIGDFVRKMMGLEEFKPTKTELERYVEEVNLYNDVISRLQYHPSDEDVRWIFSNCPVCIEGESTSDVEVSAYRDLSRFETNRVRGGICLVSCEGIALKAKKVLKFAKKAGLDWSWLENIIKAPKKGDSKQEVKKTPKYMKDIVGGRPIFAYPSRKGGFRLRYGRSRNSGLNAKCLHPATLIVLDEFPAIATQLKIEKPGKGMVVATNDSIMGPVVKLLNGDVFEVKSVKKAQEIRKSISKILFVGDILISYGDFLKANQTMEPPGFCSEWWELIVREKNLELGEINSHSAVDYARKYNIPLHPDYTYFYTNLSKEEFKILMRWLSGADISIIKGLDGRDLKRLSIANAPEKSLLEAIYVPHIVRENRIIIEDAYDLIETLGLPDSVSKLADFDNEDETILSFISKVAGFQVYDKAGTFIGARMGRPEKAKPRLMAPPPHGLVPIGLYGGKIRSIPKAAEKGKVSIDLVNLVCPKCNKQLFSYICPDCNERGIIKKQCMRCGKVTNEDTCPACGSRVISHHKYVADFKKGLMDISSKYGRSVPDKFKGVKGVMSDSKYFEPLEKAFLRSINEVFIFKDGTIRFDSSNMTLMFFKPKELDLSVEKVHELGYKYDYKGKEITEDSQIIELKPQDMIVSKSCAEYLFNTSKFVDDELEKFYGLERYYNCEKKEDLIGELMIALAPHTSAGVGMRILGFTEARCNFSHPYAVTARRRDCFHPDTTFPIFDGKNWSIVKMGKFIDKLIEEKDTEKEYLTESVIKTNQYSTLSVNKNGDYEIKPITAFSRHEGAEHLVELTAKGNKKIMTTGTHNLVAPDFKKQIPTSISKVTAPSVVDIPEKDLQRIDFFDICKDYVMVKGIQKELKTAIEINGGLKEAAKKLGLNKKTLFNYTARDSAPKNILDKLSVNIPESAKINAKGDTVELPRIINVNKDFLKLIGIYLAEGYSKKTDRCYQVVFCNKNLENLVMKQIKNVFGIKPYKGKEEVVISSRLVYDLFTGLLGAGSNAYTKRVPKQFFGLPLSKLKYLLQGYYEGDGGICKSNAVEVHCTSVNKMLLKDIEFILLRYGITSDWYRDKRSCKSGRVYEFNKKKNKPWINDSYKLRIYGNNAKNFVEKIGFLSSKKIKKSKDLIENSNFRPVKDKNNFSEISVKKTEIIANDLPTYNITVADNHNLIASGINSFQCDGDEDAVMLMLDALLNFSKKYLPSKIGGQMDAPLVVTTIINPMEVDDQSHDMETVYAHDLDFYKKCLQKVNPSQINIPLIKDRLGKENQCVNLGFTHDTTTFDEGPKMTQYVMMKSMKEKVEKELELGEKINAVDVADIATRIINFHFMRDLYGNLRAFGQQKFRCVSCNQKYRRVPLAGKCTKCGGKLLLTVNKGGIQKYLGLSRQMAEKYGLSNYLQQRIDMLEQDIETIFTSDKIKQHSLADFM